MVERSLPFQGHTKVHDPTKQWNNPCTCLGMKAPNNWPGFTISAGPMQWIAWFLPSNHWPGCKSSSNNNGWGIHQFTTIALRVKSSNPMWSEQEAKSLIMLSMHWCSNTGSKNLLIPAHPANAASCGSHFTPKSSRILLKRYTYKTSQQSQEPLCLKN